MVREMEIQKAIMDYLDANAVTWWRCSMGGIRHSGIGWKKNPMKGYPDLALIHPHSPGQLVTIEVKTPAGRMSEEQKMWQRKLTAAGAIYIIATSVQDVRVSLGLDANRNASHANAKAPPIDAGVIPKGGQRVG